MPDEFRYAVLSDCGRYRYYLFRHWQPGERVLLWIMLNPSTADAEQDDATIRRCRTYSQRWGYDAMMVGNLFAYRATDPGLLWTEERMGIDIVGPENDEHLAKMARCAADIVVAWGAKGAWCQERVNLVMRLLYDAGRGLKALGVTHNGHPHHPLRLSGVLQPQAWFCLVMERASELAKDATDEATISVCQLRDRMVELGNALKEAQP